MTDEKGVAAITVADLRSYDWQDVLAHATEPDCHKYYGLLFTKAAD
jgi:hypothetical protein